MAERPVAPKTVTPEFLAEALEHIMAQNEELQRRIDAQHQATTQHLAAVQVEIQQVMTLAQQILALQSELEAGKVTQAQLDELAANTQSLVEATGRLAADDELTQPPAG